LVYIRGWVDNGVFGITEWHACLLISFQFVACAFMVVQYDGQVWFVRTEVNDQWSATCEYAHLVPRFNEGRRNTAYSAILATTAQCQQIEWNLLWRCRPNRSSCRSGGVSWGKKVGLDVVGR
jgi:hypothetical protein